MKGKANPSPRAIANGRLAREEGGKSQGAGRHARWRRAGSVRQKVRPSSGLVLQQVPLAACPPVIQPPGPLADKLPVAPRGAPAIPAALAKPVISPPLDMP